MYISILSTNHPLIDFLIYRTTKTGGLPDLTYVQRKPEPLGTELKCFVDAVLMVMLFVEIQEGRVRMSKKSILIRWEPQLHV